MISISPYESIEWHGDQDDALARLPNNLMLLYENMGDHYWWCIYQGSEQVEADWMYPELEVYTLEKVKKILIEKVKKYL